MENHVTSTLSTTTISVLQLDEISESYNYILTQSAHKFAPEIKHKAISCHRNLWYTSEIHTNRILRGQLERKWIKSRLTIDIKSIWNILVLLSK